MAGKIGNSAHARRVDVCVCTFRRPSVADVLASLAKQDLPETIGLRVIVADNDETPSARERVERAFADLGLDGVYLHAPARNISIARNACLDAAIAPLVAFIDDDEVARPDWLASLVAEIDRAGADIVFGKVNASYGDSAPGWMRAADLHSTPAPFYRGRVEGGYTCNVLMRRETVGALRFDPAFGRSGGEDTTFFTALNRKGAKLAYTPAAVVLEPVTANRESLGWLTTRAYRSGQTYGLVRLRDGESRVGVVVASAVKLGAFRVAQVLTLWSPVKWRKNAVRANFHAGVMAAALGRAPLELYGAANG